MKSAVFTPTSENAVSLFADNLEFFPNHQLFKMKKNKGRLVIFFF